MGFSCSPHLFRSCDLRAKNRLGLQLNPLQIPRIMDTATSKSLRTGPYKLHPPLIVNVTLGGRCINDYLYFWVKNPDSCSWRQRGNRSRYTVSLPSRLHNNHNNTFNLYYGPNNLYVPMVVPTVPSLYFKMDWLG